MFSKFTKISIAFLALILIFNFYSCSEEFVGSEELNSVVDGSYDVALVGSATGGGSTTGQGSGGNNAGLVTAGEWNDLENWDFWTNLLNQNDFHSNIDYWEFYTNNRVSVVVNHNNFPINNAKVSLKQNNEIVWETMTDNFGKAELWVGLNSKTTISDSSDYQLFVNDILYENQHDLFSSTVVIDINSYDENITNNVELAFIVDATGSMGDELEFLKDDLRDVIKRVEENNNSLNILTGTVFYRDVLDEYVVKHSGFTNDISKTISFIAEQKADGGGDYPEAVHTALNEAINQLQWSQNSKTRIAFLMLDAPPHYEPQIIDNLHSLIAKSAQKGIKIIPITASGIDKETEFLMRFFSIATNGTYVFITNDSGIGNDHITASVGDYDVEFLNDLMVRLINKYSSTIGITN